MKTTRYSESKRLEHNLFKDIFEYGLFRGISKFSAYNYIRRLAKKNDVHETDIMFAYWCIYIRDRYVEEAKELLGYNYWKNMRIMDAFMLPEINYLIKRFDEEFPNHQKEILEKKIKELTEDLKTLESQKEQ